MCKGPASPGRKRSNKVDWGTVSSIVVGVPLAFLVMALTGAIFFGVAGSFMAERMGGLPKCPCASMSACGSGGDTEQGEPA
jgi:hypothetical protein